MTRVQYLRFNILVLRLVNLWPINEDYVYNYWRLGNDASMIMSLMPCALPILTDFGIQLYEGVVDLTAVIENLIALNCIFAMIYMVICFVKKRRLIKKLVLDIEKFKQFDPNINLKETDHKADLYSKVFLFYGILGNVVYMLMPQLSVDKCHKNRSQAMIDKGIPCGLVTRCRFPFKFDYSPVFEIVFVHQFYTCTMVTIVILVLTMLICGFLMHLTNQLIHLRSVLRKLPKLILANQVDVLTSEVHFYIKYHNAIIKYAKNLNEAFSSMMLLHISLTSLVISVLGFEVVVLDNIYDSLRFFLHLFGWFVILLLICYYGQSIIDESTGIAVDIYEVPWYLAPVSVQKDIRMILTRAQKPLQLSAANMGTISFPTFIRVMSNAYSYFTLLLKIRS